MSGCHVRVMYVRLSCMTVYMTVYGHERILSCTLCINVCVRVRARAGASVCVCVLVIAVTGSISGMNWTKRGYICLLSDRISYARQSLLLHSVLILPTYLYSLIIYILTFFNYLHTYIL